MVCYGGWYSPVWYVMEVGIAQYHVRNDCCARTSVMVCGMYIMSV